MSLFQSCRMLKKTVRTRCADTAVTWIIIDTLHSKVFSLCPFRWELLPIPTPLCSMAAAVLFRTTNFKVCFHCSETQSPVKPKQHQSIYCKPGSYACWGAGKTHTQMHWAWEQQLEKEHLHFSFKTLGSFPFVENTVTVFCLTQVTRHSLTSGA